MAREFKTRQGADDGENENGLNFQKPETQGTIQTGKDLIKQMHILETEEDEKAGKPKKKRPPREVCFCGDPSCGIGPFIASEGGEEDA